MTPSLRRNGVISAGLHGAVLLALLLTLKPLPAPPMGESAVTMEFAIESGEVQRAPTPAPQPSPNPADVPSPEMPAQQKPRPEPTEPPPPPPPPPRPAPMATPVPTPPAPAPPAQRTAPAVPSAETPSPLPPPAPPIPVPPIPPPPAPAPPRPAPQTAPAPKPEPKPPTPRPAPERPQPAERTDSRTNQPNPTRNTAAESRALEATLERLRSLQPQTKPPQRRDNPADRRTGGGALTGVENANLSASVRGAIGDTIRECWTRDAGALDADKQIVRLIVTTDPTGTIRIADISPNDASRSNGGVARSFAERARRAALEPQCSKLPLPPAMLGQNHTFEITFRP